MFVWADTAVNRTILGWQMPVTWIGTADGLLTVLGVVVANRIWIAQSKRGREPHDFNKIAIGYALISAAFLLIAGFSLLAAVPIILWILFYLVLDFGYGWTEPPFQSLVSRDAPASINATMMAIMQATIMLSYFLLGWMGRFYEPLGPPLYWTLLAAIAGLSALFMFVFHGPLLRLLEPQAV